MVPPGINFDITTIEISYEGPKRLEMFLPAILKQKKCSVQYSPPGLTSMQIL